MDEETVQNLIDVWQKQLHAIVFQLVTYGSVGYNIGIHQAEIEIVSWIVSILGYTYDDNDW